MTDFGTLIDEAWELWGNLAEERHGSYLCLGQMIAAAVDAAREVAEANHQEALFPRLSLAMIYLINDAIQPSGRLH